VILCEGLGFKYLSNQEQQAYRVMQNAFLSQVSSFDCSQIVRSVDVMKILQTVLGDNPSIIYFNKTQIQMETSIFGKKIILSGVPSKSQVEKMNLTLDVAANRIISSVKAASVNEHSILTNLYHYLQKNVQYDKKEMQENTIGINNTPDSHNAYGAIINKIAVCDGFSSAFALLAQKLGFECMLVLGHSVYSLGTFSDHAWNIVKMRDRFYHMDVTWDARKYDEFGEYSYDYFMLQDEEISNDHSWDKKTTPACLYNDFSFYLKNGLYVKTSEQLNQVIKAYGDRQANVFRMKLSCNISLPSNAGEYLAQKVVNEGVKFTGRIKFSYGWNEKTRCFFAKILN